MSPVVEAALAALIPGVVGGLVLLSSARIGAPFAAFAVSLAYFCTHSFLLGLPELQAGPATERLPWLALLLGVATASCARRPGRLGRTALLFACVFAVWWVTESARQNQLSLFYGTSLACLILLLSVTSAQLAPPAARRAEAWTTPALSALVALFLAPALVLGRSAVLGQLCGAVCAASVAAVVLSKLRDDREGGALVSMVAAPMIILIAACGALYAYLDPWSAACFGVAPACIGLGFKREGGWSQARAFGAAALLCALGLGLAYLGAPAPTPYDY